MSHQTDTHYLQEVAYAEADDLDIRNDILDQYRTHRQSWYEWLFDRLALPANSFILDRGCGPGDLWVKNRWRLAPDWQIALADFSPGMVQEASERLDLCSRGREAVFYPLVLETTHLPFAAGTWDAVLALGLLDHVAEPEQALAEMCRVLKPGGTFYASAGGRAHLREMEALLKPLLPDIHLGGDADQFGLHNGLALLTPFFTGVVRHYYENELVFFEPEPIVAFVLSEAAVREQLTTKKRSAWQRWVEQWLAERGEMRVTLQKGVFVGKPRPAVKPPG